MSQIAVGDAAPDFTLAASGGRTVSAAGLKGQPYLLYFYPKASTPGCTTQACGIQEVLPAFDATGLTVIGVSPDALPAIEKFAAKKNLTFPLASDPEHQLAEAYGTWVEKQFMGKRYMGFERSSFLVDRKGKIAAIWRKVKPDAHAAQVLEAAKALA